MSENAKRASSATAESLHGLVFDLLIADLKRFKEAGEPVPPALYAQAIKLLKDNGIDSPERAKRLLDTLAQQLPVFDDDGEYAKPTTTN